jgi:hypothetical protein
MGYGRDHARLVMMRDGSIAFHSSYDQGLVQALKDTIPSQDRRWNKDEKHWRVDPKHAKTLVRLAKNYLFVDAEIQGSLFQQQAKPEIAVLKLEYLGTAKDRGGDEPTAYGWVDGNWNAVFPLSVLKTWFNIAVHDVEAPITLYGVLGVKQDIVGADLKKAYRRAAKQWHPDVSKESNAQEMFVRIQEAYEILSDPLKRRKFAAGMVFEKTLSKNSIPTNSFEKRGQWWYPPLRCGWITIQGLQSLGRWSVETIHEWQDIERNGKTMVTTWMPGAKHFITRWI